MSDYEQKDNTGVLFKNNKTKDSQPDYTGTITIGGIKKRLASWVQPSKSGKKYMSLKISDFQPKNDTGHTYTTTTTNDADIPF